MVDPERQDINAETDILYRKLVPADYAELTELGRSTFTDTFGFVYRSDDLEKHLSASYNNEVFDKNMAEQNGIIIVAEVIKEGYTGPRLVGFAKMGINSLEVDAPSYAMELRQLYIRKTTLGSGLGQVLMALAMRYILAFSQPNESENPSSDTAAQRPVYLGVWENNHRAQAFYRRWGFTRKAGEYKYFVGDNGHFDLEHILEYIPETNKHLDLVADVIAKGSATGDTEAKDVAWDLARKFVPNSK